MSEATDHIDTIIANAIETADLYTTKAGDSAQDLINASTGFYLDPPPVSSGFSIEAIEPGIPDVADSTLTYEAQLKKMIALLSGQLAGFFATYYPLANDAFDEATAWLVNTITTGDTGINAAIEDQVWQRGRERIIADGRRTEAQIVTGYAAKGHFFPSGSMTRKIEESRMGQAANNGVASTSIAAKQLEIEIETVKFAVGKAIDSRTMAMNAAADYIRAIASTPDAAARVASINTDAKAKMMAAAGDFYRARLSRDEIVLRSKIADTVAGIDVYKHRRDNAVHSKQTHVSALASAAEVFGGAARAALSSLSSVASTGTNAFSS